MAITATAPEGKLRSPASPFGRNRTIVPGFGLSFGITIFWLCLIVLLPMSALFARSVGLGLSHFAEVGFSSRAMAAYRLSFGAAMMAAFVNAIFGLLIAWVLVRYRFPGKRVVSAMVDLPFALPTAVAGIALTALYASNGWVGGWLDPEGIHRAPWMGSFALKVAYTPIGVTVALVFIGLPFVVRSVEPVLADLGKDVEEASASLGAGRLQTFTRVILPAILPALLTGFALAFARGVGEYGSVIFIAGNMPFKSEIAPLLIVTQLEQFDYAGATAIATIMLGFSFLLLLLINLIQIWSRKRMG